MPHHRTFHRNFNKRLVKTPKLHFVDAGLAAWLLGIEDATQLATHPLRGVLFETWVVSEFMKDRSNAGRPPALSFWRDRGGHEVDLLQEHRNRVLAVEVKAGATVAADALRGLKRWQELIGDDAGAAMLVYGGPGEKIVDRRGVTLVPWAALVPHGQIDS